MLLPLLLGVCTPVAAEPIFQIATDDLSPLFQLLSLIVSTTGTVIIGLTAYWMRQLEKNTNNKMDLLLETVAEAAEAKGLLQGRSEGIQR